MCCSCRFIINYAVTSQYTRSWPRMQVCCNILGFHLLHMREEGRLHSSVNCGLKLPSDNFTGVLITPRLVLGWKYEWQKNESNIPVVKRIFAPG